MSSTTAIEPAPMASRWRRPSFWAAAVALVTFPLIWAGGLVTTTDAGMAVPDWPGTYGYNLLLYPLSTWISGPFDLFAEHGHRLLATLVGFLSILLVFSTYLSPASKGLRFWAWMVLIAVIAQGILGGVRVLLSDRALALVHGCTGPLFFLLATYVAILAMRPTYPSSAMQNASEKRGYVVLTTLLTLAAFLQLVIGANLRHIDPQFSPTGFMGLTHLHLLVATVLTLLAFGISLSSLRQRVRQSSTRRKLPYLLLLLVIVQLILGFLTWYVNYALPWTPSSPKLAAHVNQLKGFWETMIVTGHQAVGSLILVTSFVLAVRAWRACRIAPCTSVSQA